MSNRLGQQFGNYRLIRFIDEGGFAEVYLGEHIYLGTQVAIKIMTVRFNSDEQKMFQNEARTIAHLKHPNIIRILEFGIEDKTPYLVMDYAGGGTLRTRYVNGPQPTSKALVPYIYQVAAALQHAHYHKLVHRDIKPENILFESDAHILLSDFGLATTAYNTNSMNTQNSAGTIHYMSPEQLQGKPRFASDQYSLAVVIYEALCGSRPFSGTSWEVAAQHLTIAPSPMTEKGVVIAPQVEAVIMKALAKDPHQRYGSIMEFAKEFEKAHQPPLILSQNNARNRDKMEDLLPNPNKMPVPVQPRAHATQAPVLIPKFVWRLPDTSLLNKPKEVKPHLHDDDPTALALMIQETLRSFRVDAEVRAEDISIGPTVIRFGIRPTGKPEMTVDDKGRPIPVHDAQGNIIYETRTRVSRIMALQNDLALVLEAKSIRMEAPVPGRPYVGVEIPNKNSLLVTLREVLESKEYQIATSKSKLAIALGKDVAGQVRVGDLARMPHLLIAGASNTGKSVAINSIIASIITHAIPDDVRMLMVSSKMVELSMYNGIPHLLAPVVMEVDKVMSLLKNAINEMERRYRLFSQLGVRNLDRYSRLRAEKLAKGDASLSNLPAIVIIIGELADLMMEAPEEAEKMICRLAQLGRAAGIHLVIATQQPSVDIITSLIKANIPTRISFMVSSAVDSRVIIDMGGAERLLGRGDMLYLPADTGRPERIQGSFLTNSEAERLVTFWREQVTQLFLQAQQRKGDPALAPTQPQIKLGWEIKQQNPDDLELDDDLLEKAEEVVREFGKASISLLQRRLRIGYSRAAHLIDLLEEHGIIGHAESGGRGREVFEGSNGGGDRVGESHSIADEVADISAEERARNEFLKKLQERRPNNT